MTRIPSTISASVIIKGIGFEFLGLGFGEANNLLILNLKAKKFVLPEHQKVYMHLAINVRTMAQA